MPMSLSSALLLCDWVEMCYPQDTYSFQLLVLPGYNVTSVTVAPPKIVNAGGVVSLSGRTLRSSFDNGVRQHTS